MSPAVFLNSAFFLHILFLSEIKAKINTLQFILRNSVYLCVCVCVSMVTCVCVRSEQQHFDKASSGSVVVVSLFLSFSI